MLSISLSSGVLLILVCCPQYRMWSYSVSSVAHRSVVYCPTNSRLLSYSVSLLPIAVLSVVLLRVVCCPTTCRMLPYSVSSVVLLSVVLSSSLSSVVRGLLCCPTQCLLLLIAASSVVPLRCPTLNLVSCPQSR